MTNDQTNDQRMEHLAICATIAAEICNGLPDYVEERDADVGTTALILCGFLAMKIVGEGEFLLSKEEFLRQMEMALSNMDDDVHPTEQ